MGSRKISAALWAAAFVVTVLLALFQRMTGPSYPLRGEASLSTGEVITFRLPRSDEGRGTLRVTLPKPAADQSLSLEWRRWPTDEEFSIIPMTDSGDDLLEASIPQQPAAGKVEYRIRENSEGTPSLIPATETVVARYRGSVPAGILIPHILAMFSSMLVSTRALFEVLRPDQPRGRGLVLVAMGFLIVGGLILGPIVQKFAFGAYWTGWPMGHDLTDNKTLIAFIAWLPAAVAAARGMKTRAVVVIGWIVMMGVFLVPHSMRGSELDWSSVEPATTQSEVR